MYNTQQITRNDIKREIAGMTNRLHLEKEPETPVLLALALGGMLVLGGAIYIAGQRRGKRTQTIVEIRTE